MNPRPGEEVTFGDLLYHPDLYVMCPDLARLPIKLIQGRQLENGELTTFRTDDSGSQWLDVASDASADDLRTALLREAQLAINRMEGW